MENKQNYQTTLYTEKSERSLIQSFFTQTYAWMFMALILSALSATIVATTPALTYFILGNQIVFFGLLFAEVGIVTYITARLHKLSVTATIAWLIAYAIINGFTLSSILFAYSFKTIGVAFFTAALIYGLMALYGSFTKSDLAPLHSFLLIGLIGGLIVSLINIFLLHSSVLDLIVSIFLILIFAGLTAYDHQKLKSFALASPHNETQDIKKMAVYGALILYLDFINMFLLLLRIFGRD